MVGTLKKKKVVKKKVVSKKKAPVKKAVSHASHAHDPVTNKVLVKNFIDLQKVMVELAGRFDSLSMDISKLLGLFEASAKHLAKKDFETAKEHSDSEKILKKLDELSEKSKLIGKGLVLIHEASSGSSMPKKEKDYSEMEPSLHVEQDEREKGHFKPKPSVEPKKKAVPAKPAPAEAAPAQAQPAASPLKPAAHMTKEVEE